MSKETVATDSWQSTTLTSDEIWKVSAGSVLIDTESVEADRSGLTLFKNDSVSLSSGLTIYYKRASKVLSLIGRMEV